MPLQLLFENIDKRIALDKEDSDYAYFNSLSLKLEYVTKIVTSGIVACIGDDIGRHRYSLEHRLVRANSIGDWTDTLNQALIGPPAQFIDPKAHVITRDLTERVGSRDWQHSIVTNLNRAATILDAGTQLGSKVALRQCFEIGTTLRNRTRGHGATTSDECAQASGPLENSLNTLIARMRLFMLPWAHLHRNLSGKYRVSPLLGNTTSFNYLKRVRNVTLPGNGVYFYLDRPVHVPLIFTDPDVLDIALPNGNHRGTKFETLSYVTNQVTDQDASKWTNPPDRLPASETHGLPVLEQFGNTFSNTPPQYHGYIRRNDLEDRLEAELLDTSRHRIVSLTGPGGIGKTTIAIAAIHRIAHHPSPPYEVILWISARDIDLLETGPTPVSPKVITQRDISRAAVELLEPASRSEKGFKPDHYFQNCLVDGAAGPTLFVLDNFETLQSPDDVFQWIDTYIRPPNKALITTRFRDFNGDYAIKIGGMTDDEAGILVDQHASRLQITEFLSSDYKKELIREADGHPYVLKILLGQVAKERSAVKPERIVASADDLLKALFERTYNALSPGGQRVYLLLSSWRVVVPEVAIESVMLRPSIEKFDVKEALRDLHRFSLVDQFVPDGSEEEQEAFVGAPLAAAMYGRRKLAVSPLKLEIDEDRKLLMEFGAGTKHTVSWGVLPRIENLIAAVAARASTSPTTLKDMRPILEYLASRVSKAYLSLSKLAWEAGDFERAKGYLRNYLESATTPDRLNQWDQLAKLCQLSNDAVGEIHALSEIAMLVASDQDELGRLANRLNSRIRDLKSHSVEETWTEQIRRLLSRVIERIETQVKDLSATNCSRLAWLYLNVGNSERALDVTRLNFQN